MALFKTILIGTILCILFFINTSCGINDHDSDVPTPDHTSTPYDAHINDLKWCLWSNTTILRGANIHQRHVYPELDGLEFIGPGPLGVPFTQEDFDRLSALGANYVNISHPGLFTEKPPYVLDRKVQDNLDNLLTMIEKADMFAIISFRTGPGRSEFTFQLANLGVWFDESYINEAVWQDWQTQEAWVEMWHYTAERYKDNPVVVGYDLMGEPNSNASLLGIYDPSQFYDKYRNSLYDSNQLQHRICNSIREVDTTTPILVSGLGFNSVKWLPYVEIVEESRVVYTVHQYEPFAYTHQSVNSLNFSYPGIWDTDNDGANDTIDKAWLEKQMSIVSNFKETNSVPVAVSEFGIMRWEPGAADFMNDQMDIFETLGLNYALWAWESSWKPYTNRVDAFNFRHGTDPNNHEDVPQNDLENVIVKHWQMNIVRPSNIQELLNP